MSHMFDGCSKLEYFPDISKWNTINLKDINNMFADCSSLKSLPDISKWNTKKVENINNIFKNCSSLIHLPDISKWNLTNVKYLDNIFSGNSSLLNIPDIKSDLNISIKDNLSNDNLSVSPVLFEENIHKGDKKILELQFPTSKRMHNNYSEIDDYYDNYFYRDVD